MLALVQHLQHLPRDAALALARLVGVGVDADRDVFGHMPGRASSRRSSSAALTFANKRLSKSRPGDSPR
jgi:hypothetical protein